MSKCRHDWAPYDTSYKAGGWEGEICTKCGEEKVAPDPRDATIARLTEALESERGHYANLLHEKIALEAESQQKSDLLTNLSAVVTQRDAELATLKARVEAWEKLAREAIEEFDDARGYASEYFTEKWGYDDTSKRFQATLRALTGEGS